jgi:hypothetical protein
MPDVHEPARRLGMIASDPGQGPRGAPDPAPLWTVLDMTPEGRGLVSRAGISGLGAGFAEAAVDGETASYADQ